MWLIAEFFVLLGMTAGVLQPVLNEYLTAYYAELGVPAMFGFNVWLCLLSPLDGRGKQGRPYPKIALRLTLAYVVVYFTLIFTMIGIPARRNSHDSWLTDMGMSMEVEYVLRTVLVIVLCGIAAWRIADPVMSYIKLRRAQKQYRPQ